MRLWIRHSGESQKQRDKHTVWMPACAGMTVAGWFEIELAGKAG
jgi:hypothetical protein